ncbi:hypothetical protein MHYP_G00169670 [Metynnis hypsauchen]
MCPTMFAVWPVNLQPALSSSPRYIGLHLLVSGEQTRGESLMMARLFSKFVRHSSLEENSSGSWEDGHEAGAVYLKYCFG